MPKLKIAMITVSAVLLASSSLCRAEFADDLKSTFRKKMMEECFNEATSSDEVPMSVAAKYCGCAVDKTLEKYSMADLIEIDNYGEKFTEFTEDLEKFANECILEMLQ